MLTLVTTLLVAAVLVRALAGYLRDRDPVQRDISLIFLPTLAISFNGAFREITQHSAPLPVAVTATALLMIQPYLTLRHTARLRQVPRWLDRTLLVFLIASETAVALAPRPLNLANLALVTATFTVTEVIAATFLLSGAQRRSGAARIRLRMAAAATYLFSGMMLLLFSGAVMYPGATSWLSLTGRIVGLVSATGYLLAFMPPAWLRRVMSVTVWYEATEDLQRLPAAVSTEQVWRRYVQVVHETTGADAVVLVRVVERGRLERFAAVCRSGTSLPHEPLEGFTEAALTELTTARQPIAVHGNTKNQKSGKAGNEKNGKTRNQKKPLAEYFAEVTGARLITALPIELSGGEQGAVLLLDRYRALFTADDLRLTGVLGNQARLIAERSTILAEQRNLAEKLAVSVDALTHASQAKSDFLAGMSHELRTPLNAIIGFSDLMRAEPPDGDRRAVPAEWIDHIHNSGRHLLGLINDILDLAKVEAGRLELNPEPLALETAVSEAITALRPLTDRKGLQVYLDPPAVAVCADPLRFRQILDNLLSNALKFTPDGGLIAITATEHPDYVAITVADSGVGIAPENHVKVFEEFQQVGTAAQRNAGTGLGLALTRRLVEAHGGSIMLSSALGEGSRFTVRLPFADLPDTSSGTPTRPGKPGRGRVLIIDDDARAAELLLTYLATAGYQVKVAPSGEEGLIAARNWTPDAILLDVIMPGLDGWDVIRELKLEPALREIPVFFATIIDDRKAGLSLGAAAFFVKPVDHDALLAQLARHIAPSLTDDFASVLVGRP